MAEIFEVDRNLTQIFIGHLYPDHYLGLEVVKDAFPDACVLAYRDATDEINDAYDFKIEYWGKQILRRNGARRKVNGERIDDPHLKVDGETIEIIGILRGDAAHEAALWIPSTRTLIGADTVFSDAHVWVADARTPQELKEWLDNLDRLEALTHAFANPGHAPNSWPYDPDLIEFTRRYLKDFIRELNATTDSAQLKEG